jgi:hypothetical protein
MLLIKSEFIKKIKPNQQKATDTKSKTGHIKGGVELVSN